jgi:4-hydroxybenzoate polyprenyltransferase
MKPHPDLPAPAAAAQGASTSVDPTPLVVDLDGALVRSDLVLESILALARRKPHYLFKLPLWLARGRAAFKRELAKHAMPDVHTLPYRPDLLKYLQEERRRGRSLVLVSAVDEALANGVARELALFDSVMASDGRTELRGEQKAKRLLARFGAGGYDYAGAVRGDRAIWTSARRAILVQPSVALKEELARITSVEHVLERDDAGLGAYLHALRPHHWVKNVLVFLPLVLAHELYDVALLERAALAFIAFTLCASSVYVLNDLLDLSSDRRHPHKRNRALASGRARVSRSLILVPLLLIAAVAVSLPLPPAFLGTLALYYLLMLCYSLGAKGLPIVDVLLLAGGYALRVGAGAAAAGVAISPWLLAFCMFLFFSLALIKRYAELVTLRVVEGAMVHTRGYLPTDRELMAIEGLTSGYLSVLVLALYTNTRMVQDLSGRYGVFWLICLLLLYWISYMWLMAHRGRIHEDPVTFALTDRVSQVLVIAMAAASLVAI